MITDEQVRWIALFFYFSLMDEKTATQAAHRAIAQLKAFGATRPDEPVSRVQIVRTLFKTWDQQKKLTGRNRVVPTTVPDQVWTLPDQLDVGPWVKFQKDAPAEQLIAVILSKILKFTDDEIAEGLNISLGTARYRVGKGIRQLGSFARA